MPESRIVVGVDGSAPSKAALRWAVRQARLTQARVEAYIAWHYPSSYAWAPVPADGGYDEVARTVLAAAVDELGAPAVDIEQHVVYGHPARVLLDAAKEADLLVVGNRGHGGFTSALLGSVSQHCVHHATCPMVIIRDENDRGDDEGAH